MTYIYVRLDVIKASCLRQCSYLFPIAFAVSFEGLCAKGESSSSDGGLVLGAVGVCSGASARFCVALSTKVASDCGEADGTLIGDEALPVPVPRRLTLFSLSSDKSHGMR